MLMLLFGTVQRTRRFRDHLAVASISLCTLFSLSMIPDVLAGNIIDWRISWAPFELGVLVDPLNVIMACVVSVIGLFVTLFSVGYMRGESSLTRFWFFIQLFIGGYIVLVMADNLLLMFFGWEIVGICCVALTTFWHKDPNKAHQGLKVFMILRVGDILLLISILLIYVYSGTLNYIDLQQQTNWMLQLSRSGFMLITTLLLFGGAVGKSAQFPLQGWLPNMLTASPSSFSALTECLAGPFLMARVLPIFHQALTLGYSELTLFFLTVTWMGVFSALLGALIAMTQRNIWHVLAYSISSAIGYMMTSLGLAGLMNDLTSGYLAGTFLLVVDAFVSGLLFLTAAFISYVVSSDDLSYMGGIKNKIAHRGMEVGVLAMISLPPLSGFWCTNWIQTVALDLAGEASRNGQQILQFSGYGVFVMLIITGAFTAFYGIRMMGFIFGKGAQEPEEGKTKKIPSIMRISFVAMLVVTMIIDFSVPLLIPFFNRFFFPLLHQMFLKDVFDVLIYILPSISTILTLLALAIGGYPAYRIYVARKSDPTKLIERHRLLGKAHTFLRNQCYINTLYYKIAYGTIRFSKIMYRYLDMSLDVLYHKIVYGTIRFSKIMYRYLDMSLDVLYHKIVYGTIRFSKASYRYVEMEGISIMGVKGVNEIFQDLSDLGLSFSRWAYARIELRGFDSFNYNFAAYLVNLSKKFRKTHTGILSYNMSAVLLGIVLLAILLLHFGGLL